MPVTALNPDIPLLCTQNVIYALPGAASVVTSDVAIEHSILYAGPFSAWGVGPVYNHVNGFIRCTSGNATVLARKVLMNGSVSGGAGNNAGRSYSAIVRKDNPSYYWNLDETTGLIAADSVGGANGTISGGVTIGQSGAVGKGMLFDGVDDKIITSPVSVVSIELWVKTSNTAQKAFIGNAGTGANRFYADFYLQKLHVHFGDKDGVAGDTPLNVGPILTDGQWHHIVVCFGSSILCYADGILVNSQLSVLLAPLVPLEIGANLFSSSYFNGTLDEVAIYPYALSPQQISSHYLAKSVPPNSYASAVMESKPTNYWQLDEEGGLVASDIVGNKHGTISGGVLLSQVGIGKSMQFDGVDDAIITSGNVTISDVATIEVWTKFGAGYNASRPLVALANEHPLLALLLNKRLQVYSSVPNLSVNGTKDLTQDIWHHVVCTFTGSICSIYVDGIFDTSGPLARPSRTSLLGIGRDVAFGAGTTGGFMQGNIDEVAIYNRALSANEIQLHYLAKFGITNPSSYAAKVVMSGPSNYWRLNEINGTTANDIVGSANGTISGGVTLNGESGMTFNGTNGQIITSNVSIPTVYTMEAWFKAPPPTGVNKIIINISDIEYFMVHATGPINYFSISTNLLGVKNVTDNQWHHAVVIRNNTQALLYVDGILDVQSACIQSVTQNLPAGISKYFGGGGFMNGSIDDVAIYPRALTPAEILDHYNSRNA